MCTCTCFAADINVKLNSKLVDFPNQQPVISDGRTLVPLRGVFDAMGYSVEWEAETKTVYLKNDINNISVPVGADSFVLNGESVELDVPAQIINSSTMLPLRAISSATGAQVSWDAETKTVNIITEVIGSVPNVAVKDATEEESTFADAYNRISDKFNSESAQYINSIADASSVEHMEALAGICDSSVKELDSLTAPATLEPMRYSSKQYISAIGEYAHLIVSGSYNDADIKSGLDKIKAAQEKYLDTIEALNG